MAHIFGAHIWLESSNVTGIETGNGGITDLPHNRLFSFLFVCLISEIYDRQARKPNYYISLAFLNLILNLHCGAPNFSHVQSNYCVSYIRCYF